MNSCKKILSVLLMVTLFVAEFPLAAAEGIRPFASETYILCSVSLSSSKSAGFYVETAYSTNICVKSVKLQKKDGGKIENVKTLVKPSNTVAGQSYTVLKDYSGSIPDGGTYRIQVVFSADGETRTASSSWVAF